MDNYCKPPQGVKTRTRLWPRNVAPECRDGTHDKPQKIISYVNYKVFVDLVDSYTAGCARPCLRIGNQGP